MQKYGLYIPPEVLDNRKLKAIEKLVFSMVIGFCKNCGGSCFCSDTYIADTLHITRGRANTAINELTKDGYISQEEKDGKRILEVIKNAWHSFSFRAIIKPSGKYGGSMVEYSGS